MTLYERIRKLRIEANMTQDDLAHAMGYKDRSMITKIESGKVDISQKKIDDFARVLHTTPAYLMGWETDEGLSWEDEYRRKYYEMYGYPVDTTPKTAEARIISGGIDKMPPERREQALKVLQTIFADYFDGGKEDGT